jgi:uncharacterized membrane protein
MDDFVAWAIIAAFYAPLHYLLPVMVLFITGNEADEVRARLIRTALLDSTLSMALAFLLVVYLTDQGHISAAMAALFASMGIPFIRIWRHRREIAGPS